MNIGSKIIYKKSLPSSMEYAKEQSSRFCDGTAIITDYIEHARGRQGRSWHVARGQLLMTIILKPFKHTPDLTSLCMALSCGIADGLSSHNVSLKWPNDFMIGNKKCGGIISEVVWQGSTINAVIVGIGLNVENSFELSDKLYDRATSLSSHAPLDRETCLQKCLEGMNIFYSLWENEKYDIIFQRWETLQACIGKKIEVHDKNGKKIGGIMKSVSSNGNLVVQTSDICDEIIPFFLVENVFVVY